MLFFILGFTHARLIVIFSYTPILKHWNIPWTSGANLYFVSFFQLFDFDIEVKPILEVLTGKTIEQSLLEVMEEEELANLRSQQRAFEELRNAELVEQQRLEEQERRHREEKVDIFSCKAFAFYLGGVDINFYFFIFFVLGCSYFLSVVDNYLTSPSQQVWTLLIPILFTL